MSAQQNINTLVNLLSITQGRDKIFRVVQYFSRLIAHIQLSRASTPQQQQAFLKQSSLLKLSNVVMTSRRILRLGNLIRTIQQIKNQSRNLSKDSSPKEILKLLSKISLFLFYLFDHIELFKQMGWFKNVKIATNNINLSLIFWLLECVFTLTSVKLQQPTLAKSGLSFSQKKKRIKQIKFDSIKSLLDIVTIIGFLRPKGIVGDKFAGVFGTASALLGVQKYWNQSK